MQTFLPYADFKKTAKCLDRARLGKQRSEAKTILNILLGRNKSNAWVNHPATKMWVGYEQALIDYGIAICKEWRKRGYKDSLLPYFLRFKIGRAKKPKWLDSSKFHRSHKSNLLRKDYDHYSKFFRGSNSLNYYWPT